jgi:hypothetical protein
LAGARGKQGGDFNGIDIQSLFFEQRFCTAGFKVVFVAG